MTFALRPDLPPPLRAAPGDSRAPRDGHGRSSNSGSTMRFPTLRTWDIVAKLRQTEVPEAPRNQNLELKSLKSRHRSLKRHAVEPLSGPLFRGERSVFMQKSWDRAPKSTLNRHSSRHRRRRPGSKNCGRSVADGLRPARTFGVTAPPRRPRSAPPRPSRTADAPGARTARPPRAARRGFPLPRRSRPR